MDLIFGCRILWGEEVINMYNSRLEKISEGIHFSDWTEVLFGSGLVSRTYNPENTAEITSESSEYSVKKQEAFDAFYESSKMKIFGFEFRLSAPVEYGN